jgi:hypothetical protein
MIMQNPYRSCQAPSEVPGQSPNPLYQIGLRNFAILCISKRQRENFASTTLFYLYSNSSLSVHIGPD